MIERRVFTSRGKAHDLGSLNKRQNQAVARALAPDPGARFKSCVEFADALGY